jgi:hypothetical protein
MHPQTAISFFLFRIALTEPVATRPTSRDRSASAAVGAPRQGHKCAGQGRMAAIIGCRRTPLGPGTPTHRQGPPPTASGPSS